MKETLLLTFVFTLMLSAKAQVTYDVTDILTERPSIGENLVWHFFSEEEGHLQNGQLSPRLKTILNQSAFENIRFPGGTVSDLFDWKETIMPVNARPQQFVHIWRSYPSTPSNQPDDPSVQFGINEAIMMAHETGKEIVPVFSPNYNTQHHIDMLEYLTAGPTEDIDGDGVFWGATRQSFGLAPVTVRVAEVGNELYGVNHHMWYQVPSDGASEQRTNGTNRKGLAFTGGTRNLTNALAHKGKGTAINAAVFDPTFLTDGVPNEVYYPFFPPVQNMSKIKVGTNFTNPANYEEFTAVSVPNPLSSAAWAAYGPNDAVCLYRKSDGLMVFGDGVNGALLPQGKKVFTDYISGPHDGYEDLYDRLKAIDPDLVISDGGYLNTTKKNAIPIHGGFKLRDARNEALIDGDIVTEMISKGYFWYAAHLRSKINQNLNGLPSGTEVIVGEHSTLDFGPGVQFNAVLDGNGVGHSLRKYTILGALQHILECERMTMLFGRHTNYPVTVFNKTSMTNQAESISTNGPNTGTPDSLYATALAKAQEFFIKHTGKYALTKIADNIPINLMKYRDYRNTKTILNGGEIPEVITYASRDLSGEYIYLTALNPSATSTYTPFFILQNAPSSAFVRANVDVAVLRSNSIYAQNAPTNRNAISIQTPTNNPDLILNQGNQRITFDVAPLSVKTVRVRTGSLPNSDVPQAGFVKIRNDDLNGLLEWTTLPDPTDATKDEVRLIADTIFSNNTTWELVNSTVAGWYNIKTETGNMLQLTDITDQIGNTTGLALRVVNSTADGSWKRWKLVYTGNGEYHLENQEFGNYIRATNFEQNGNLPAYLVHGGPASSNGGWAKWKVTNVQGLPASWAYIDNAANLNSIRLQQRPENDPSPGAVSAGANEVLLGLAQWSGDWVQWQLIPVTGTDYFYIEGKANPKRLQCLVHTENKDGIDGYATRIVPNTYSGDAVQWQLIDRGDRSYYIKNKNTGYFLRSTDIVASVDPDFMEVFAIPSASVDDQAQWQIASAGSNVNTSIAGNILSVGENEVQLVYPNPVQLGERLHIAIGENIKESNITILDLLGRVQNSGLLIEEDNQLILDTSTLNQGTYIVSIYQNNTYQYIKFMVK